ncbi:MAG: hypothetical protein M1829_000202 [Trizodia sp. TS-e1964]|nr:MAG: hypothetical protein M1829_000202 [Trizodia sp. TS-e1964]
MRANSRNCSTPGRARNRCPQGLGCCRPIALLFLRDIQLPAFVPNKDTTPSTQLLPPSELRFVVTEIIDKALDKEKEIIQILKEWNQIFNIFSDLSQKGWAHKDLSHSNVGIMAEGKVALLDFDLACRLPRSKANAVDRTGTPAFQSCEILRGNLAKNFSHNLMHGLESVFWVGYIALSLRGKDPGRIIPLTRENTLTSSAGFPKKTISLD